MTSGNSLHLTHPTSIPIVIGMVEKDGKDTSISDTIMSHVEEEPKPKDNWTENDLKEAIRRINAGEINFKEAENVYGISPRTIHRQRAIENMRAQLNPEKAKKLKTANTSAPKKDVTILRKPLEISCSTLGEVVGLLNTGTEEVKQLLNHECDLIYECKVCKNLFRSLANFISHKRIYCCDLYSVIHTRTDENDDESELVDHERLKEKENIKEFTAKPYRVTCKKDLTAVLKRITTMAELLPAEPILHLQTIESTPCAFQQVLFTNENDIVPPFTSFDNESKENKEVVCTVEPEKEKPPSVEKNNEKSSNLEKHFVAEKRFRCPVCLSNFTIKRSVLRHLKSVHHKSVEQVEKLKSRIQVHFVRIKNNSGESNKEKTGDLNCLSSLSTSNPEQTTDNCDNECALCGRTFGNKGAYVIHIKHCRRHSSRSDASSEDSPNKSISLVPVIALTPITTASYSSKSESEDNAEPVSSETKTLDSSGSSKKVSLPLTTSTNSQSKKIGIQVRMNYCKETTSAPNSANATPSYATSSVASSPTGDNSRRNSILSIIGIDDIPKIEQKFSHNTRSGSKLANILENLCDKRNRTEKELKNDKTVPKSVEDDVKNTKSDVTIYCNSCRKVYALSDFNCDVTQENFVRYFKCTLRDCDFRSNSITELVSHLSANHSVLPETEIASVRSIFLAGFLDENGLDSLGDCKRRPISYERTEDGKFKKKTNVSDKPAVTDSISTDTSSVTLSQNSSNKRKLPCNSNKTVILKKKHVSDKERIKNDSGKINDIKIKEEKKDTSNSINNTPKITDDIENIKIEINENDEDSPQNEPPAIIKKTKKAKKEEPKISHPKLNKSINDSSSPVLVNGIIGSTLSSDDENDRAQITKVKIIHNKNIRKPNIPSIDPKVWKSQQRMTLNSLHNDLSPSSSTPDSDFDQLMNEENTQSNIMTIIFGKDMSVEKVEESVCNREKSPSSSTSSDCGKEKRYSFRIAKQTTQVKPTLPVENKEDKTLKPPCLIKAKPSSR